MKNKLVFVLEPCSPVRVILVNAIRRKAIAAGFSSIESLESALRLSSPPQIILLPSVLAANYHRPLLALLEDYRLNIPDNVKLMYYEKPFNPDRIVRGIETQLTRRTAGTTGIRHLPPDRTMREKSHTTRPTATKRLLEGIIGVFLLILLSPVFLLISIGILLDSGGPVLYRSRRAGRAYRIFDFYKFRTMSEGHTSTAFVKIQEGAGMTAFGSWLRSTSLDELPQLWNVVKGDMSIVGNRPLPLYEAELLTTDVWALRFMAPAGITGLWQVKRRHNPDMTVTERLRLDIAYARKNGFFTDAGILFQTPGAMWQKVGPGTFVEAVDDGSFSTVVPGGQ